MGGGGPGAWGWRAHGGMGGGCHAGRGMGGGHGGRGAEHPKLGARFVRDVTIFDGTQMAPGTTFTKIWRLKNVGEVPWPPGARMLFVGGDQMTSEMSVPLSRASSVMPGEEGDVAVEMTAPTEHGRYLGYWRLTGPFMRRKFGQRVWCHVHVIDPNQSGVEAFDDLPSTLAEIERKKSDLAAADGPADDELDAAKELSLAPAAEAPPPSDAPAVDGSLDVSDATAKPVPADDQVNDDAPGADEASKDGSASDDGVLVTVDGVPASPAEDPAAEAGARDLAAATEWDHLLDDLAEMGFENRMLNTTLMLKNGGNMKRTVRDLVEA